jgi:hypothetical protein
LATVCGTWSFFVGSLAARSGNGRHVIRTRQLRSVAFPGNQAKESERTVRRSVKLVPGQGIDRHEVTLTERMDLATDLDGPAPAQDQHRVRVFVTFER